MADVDKTIEAVLASAGGGDGEPQIFLERYRVVRCLGRGGMGVVYEAKHEVLNSRHAIKVLVSRLRGAGSDIIAERFLREARLCVSLRHPNLVLVTDCGIDQGHPVIVMDLIEGTDLGKYTRGGAGVKPATVVRIGAQAAAALNALHQRGIVHRDIKPSNLMLERETGRVVLMDLGISRQADEASDMTMGSTLGTPAYMAPEQALSSSTVGPAADVYSLGAAFAALLAARPPVETGTAYEMIDRVKTQVAASGTIFGLYPDLERDLTAELADLLRDMTRYRPNERITCAEIRDRLVAMDRAAGPLAGPTLDATLPIVVAPASDFLTPSSATPTPSTRNGGNAGNAKSGTFMPPALAADLDQLKPADLAAPSAPSRQPRRRSSPWILPLALLPLAIVAAWWAFGRSGPSLPPADPAPGQLAPSPRPADPAPVEASVRAEVAPALAAALPPVPSAAAVWPKRHLLSLPGGETMELLLIPPGSVRLGSDDPQRANEHPRVAVAFTAPRWLGRFEVTCAQYAPFLAARGPLLDPGFDQFEETAAGIAPRASLALHPVRGVTVAEARDYGSWLSQATGVTLRLPGEAEWEYAARGPTGRIWPWGDIWRPDRCRADGHEAPVAVGTFPSGASWCGVEDLAGNLFEWTDDWFDEQRWATLAKSDPRPDPVPQSDGMTVVRGGCFANPRQLCRSSSRPAIRADRRDGAVGFRLITDHPPAAPAPARDIHP